MVGALVVTHGNLARELVRAAKKIVGEAPRLQDVVIDWDDDVGLARNAIQVMPEGGELLVRSHQIGDSVFLRFRDRGPGVPPENRERIFNPLFTTRAEGTGLGLAICNKTVMAHGGKLSVRDAPGGGAEFVIQLPVVSRARSSGTGAVAGRG